MISLHLAYTKAGEVERGPQRVDRGQEVDEGMVVDLYKAEQDEGQGAVRIKEVKSAVWLVMTCNQTGTLGAVPLQSKGQLSLMAREVMTFVQNLGHVEIGLYGDNELRSLLRIILIHHKGQGLSGKLLGRESSMFRRRRWSRRSRMVAREYANDKRDDVFSPASGYHVLRALPALFLNSVGPPVVGSRMSFCRWSRRDLCRLRS